MSLKAPADRESNQLRLSKETIPEHEVPIAMKALNKDIRFTQVEKYYADPVIYGQHIALVSFVPAKGAKPDKDNIYGMMKVRGVFASEQEANDRAEFIIKNVDSYNEIFHTYVGRPFPITNSDMYSNEIETIDIRQKTTDIISNDILAKKKNEKQEIEQMKEREKALLEESKKAQQDSPLDEFEQYITQQVKRAQLIWTYKETLSKLKQMKESIKKSSEILEEMDKEHPDFMLKYKDKYYQARKEANLKDEDENSFLKYLGKDLEASILNDIETEVQQSD